MDMEAGRWCTMGPPTRPQALSCPHAPCVHRLRDVDELPYVSLQASTKAGLTFLSHPGSGLCSPTRASGTPPQ